MTLPKYWVVTTWFGMPLWHRTNHLVRPSPWLWPSSNPISARHMIRCVSMAFGSIVLWVQLNFVTTWLGYWCALYDSVETLWLLDGSFGRPSLIVWQLWPTLCVSSYVLVVVYFETKILGFKLDTQFTHPPTWVPTRPFRCIFQKQKRKDVLPLPPWHSLSNLVSPARFGIPTPSHIRAIQRCSHLIPCGIAHSLSYMPLHTHAPMHHYPILALHTPTSLPPTK